MEIIFSPYFDQPVYVNDSLPENNIWLNKTLAGPLKLLGILEVYLGLVGKFAPNNRRAQLYRIALEQSVSEDSFFADSLKADPAKTANALLKWRDELVLGGSDLVNANKPPQRIKDLQTAEKVFKQNRYVEYAGPGDRWQKVVQRISNGAALPKINIKILYPEKLLTGWQQNLLTGLKSHPEISLAYIPDQTLLIQETNDLGNLKKALLLEIPEKINLKCDGSVIIIHTSDQAEGAQLLSNYFLQDKKGTSTVLVSESGLNLPAATLSMHGLPAIKIQSELKEDPLLQLLKLVPACVYAPLNVSKFTELLMFPILPFNLQLARKFARLMSNTPGRGSDAWEEVKREWFEKQEDKTNATEQLEKIKFYLEEPLLDEKGPHAQAISARVIAILEHLVGNSSLRAKSMRDTNPFLSDSMFRLSKACSDLISSFNKLSDQAILTRLTYDQLSREVISSSEHTIAPAQLHSCEIARNGSCLISPAEELIVWDCIKGENPGRITWLPDEIDWFVQNSIAWADPAEIYQQRYYNDTQLVTKTSRRLILLIPDTVLGETTEKGGLYSRIKAVTIKPHLLEYRFPEQKDKMKELLGISTVPRKKILLPGGAPDYWRINDTSNLEPREYESYSSLEDLLHYPYVWFLRYQAKIRTSAMLSLSTNEAALQGTLAHRIMEKVIETAEDPFNIPKENLTHRIDQFYDDILEKEGALLLLPEMKKKNSYFRYILQQSIPIFLEECKMNGWKKISMEQQLEKHIGPLKVSSRLDVLLEKENAKAVIDIKYFRSGERVSEMASDNDIQLILYAGLAEEDNIFPMSAYFFVKHMQFLAKHRLAFRNAEITGKTGENAEALHKELLKKIIRTAEYRWNEIKQEGKIEVGDGLMMGVLDIFTQTDADLMPLPGLRSKNPEKSIKEARKYNDYENLIKVN